MTQTQMISTPRRERLSRLWETSGMLLVFVAILVVCGVTIPYFATLQNMINLLLSVTTIAFVACTMMLCLASGDFDLSVGSTAALAGMLCVLTINHFVQQPILAIALGVGLGLFAGAVVGLTNGILITKGNINALIATLGTMQIVRGLAYLPTNGASVGTQLGEFSLLGNSTFPTFASFKGISMPIWYMLVFFVLFGILLNRTVFGRNALAIGGNKEAARLAGIAVDRVKIVIFTLQGIAAAFAGIVLASRLTSGQPGNGQGLELQAISACVLGGVSLTGGIASMTGVIVGLLIMGTVQNALNLLNVSPYNQYVVNGGILLAAVLFDSLKQRLRR